MTDELPPKPEPTPPLARRLFGGVVWMTSMRWLMRLLGLISTAILARLLTPADFGLVAMATSIIALVTVVIELGVDTALVRDKHAGRVQFDTAWTLRLMQMTAVAALIVALAPLAADYYQDPRVRNILWVAAGTVFLNGCENIGIVDFRRQLEFNKDFRYNLITRTVGVAGTIVLAFALKSYWALVLGAMFTSLSRVILSYTLHPYRPKISLAAFRELWGVSQWLLLRGIAMGANRQADILVLGRVVPPGLLGQYNISRELANMVSNEITQPALRTLMPGMSQLLDQPDRLRDATLKSMGAVATVVLPATIGFGLVAGELVPLLLGSQWVEAIPLLQIFALASAFLVITLPGGNLCVLFKDMKFVTLQAWGALVVRLSLIIPAYHQWGIYGAAAVSIAVQAFSAAFLMWRMCKLSRTSLGGMFSILLRPLLATGVMALAVLGLQSAVMAETPGEKALLLLAEAAAGGLTYMACVLALWQVQSRPDGLETHLMRYLTTALGRLKG